MTETLLDGWQVLIASSSTASNTELIRLLGGVGASGQVVPLISITPPADLTELDAALLALSVGDYRWVAFTSANTVRAIVKRADELDLSPIVFEQTRVAAIGPATLNALKDAGVSVDLLPEEHRQSAAGLAQIWPAPHEESESVLLPGSQIALDTLEGALAAIGYESDRVIAYLTQYLPPPTKVVEDLRAGAYRAVLLNSPSAAGSLASATTLGADVILGCIGHTTAKAAAAYGFTVNFVATSPTPAALVAGLVAYSSTR